MCGIVYAKNKRGSSVVKLVIKRYHQQEGRGKAGYGFYIPAINRLTHHTKESGIIRQLRKHNASEILFHHRIPTSTENVRNACHPFSTKDYFGRNYVVVHNGIISNDRQLEKAHKKLGIKYTSRQRDGKAFNDSEALAWDIALTLEGKQKKMLAKGSMAFVAFVRSANGKPYRLYYGRNSGSPLWYDESGKQIVISSEVQPRSNATEVPVDTLHWCNYANGSRGSRKMVFAPTPVSKLIPYYKKGANDYYYPKYDYTYNRTTPLNSRYTWYLSPEAISYEAELREAFPNRDEAILEMGRAEQELEERISYAYVEIYGDSKKTTLMTERELDDLEHSKDTVTELREWYLCEKDKPAKKTQTTINENLKGVNDVRA